MSIIKANKCEVEIQEQTVEDAGCKYMTVISYEPQDKLSKEIITVVLSDLKPTVKKTIDLGNRVVEKDIPTTDKPKDVTTPEQLLGLESTHE